MRIVDNIIALRILWLLITPFEKTDAFKLGLIDDQGSIVRKAKTPEETNATSMLHRLVWRIKKFINMVPGGSTKIGSMVAAYALVRECMEKDIVPDSQAMQDRYYALNESDFDAEDEIVQIIEQFTALQEEIANVTGAAVNTNIPVIKKKKKNGTFDKFKEGKTKFRRWGSYLNLDDSVDQEIYQFAKQHDRGFIVLLDENDCAKGVYFSKVSSPLSKRKPKQIVESYLDDMYTEMEVVSLC